MKKMKYQNVVCEVEVVPDAAIRKEVPCKYGKDTIVYAVERFSPKAIVFAGSVQKRAGNSALLRGRRNVPAHFPTLSHQC